MNKNTGVIIGIIVVALVVGGVYASMGSKNVKTEENKMAAEKAMMEKKAVEEKDAMMKKDEAVMADKGMDNPMEKGDAMMMKGSYETYSAEKIARAEKGDVVLFFHASWCPSCRSINSDIESNISSIPEGVSILKVDYDRETELKKKYGVTYQHTFVQVDKDGNLIKKWSGSPKLSNLVSEIQ
jgi:thioredoxin 1